MQHGDEILGVVDDLGRVLSPLNQSQIMPDASLLPIRLET